MAAEKTTTHKKTLSAADNQRFFLGGPLSIISSSRLSSSISDFGFIMVYGWCLTPELSRAALRPWASETQWYLHEAAKRARLERIVRHQAHDQELGIAVRIMAITKARTSETGTSEASDPMVTHATFVTLRYERSLASKCSALGATLRQKSPQKPATKSGITAARTLPDAKA